MAKMEQVLALNYNYLLGFQGTPTYSIVLFTTSVSVTFQTNKKELYKRTPRKMLQKHKRVFYFLANDKK